MNVVVVGIAKPNRFYDYIRLDYVKVETSTPNN